MELADRDVKVMGVEETDMEVPISEMAPHPVPGWQYVSWAGRVLQGCNDGGGSRATTTEAGGGIDDAHTSLSNADLDRSSLAAEAGFGTEVTGLDFRAELWP